MSNYSITDHIAPYDLHRTLDLISKDFSEHRVVIYLFQSLDSLSISI